MVKFLFFIHFFLYRSTLKKIDNSIEIQTNLAQQIIKADYNMKLHSATKLLPRLYI